jgi:hypothetical protein
VRGGWWVVGGSALFWCWMVVEHCALVGWGSWWCFFLGWCSLLLPLVASCSLLLTPSPLFSRVHVPCARPRSIE